MLGTRCYLGDTKSVYILSRRGTNPKKQNALRIYQDRSFWLTCWEMIILVPATTSS